MNAQDYANLYDLTRNKKKTEIVHISVKDLSDLLRIARKKFEKNKKKKIVFTDMRCPQCYGTGTLYFGTKCPMCNGNGIIGWAAKETKIKDKGDKKFGEKLRSAREKSMITMNDLAKIAGISVVELSDIEQGRENPRTETFLILSEFIKNFEEGSKIAKHIL